MTAVTVRRRIAAPAERLFDAWLDPASLAMWMRRDDTGEPSLVVADPRVGGAFSITMRDRFGTIAHSGTYRVIDRPRTVRRTSSARSSTLMCLLVEFSEIGKALARSVTRASDTRSRSRMARLVGSATALSTVSI